MIDRYYESMLCLLLLVAVVDCKQIWLFGKPVRVL